MTKSMPLSLEPLEQRALPSTGVIPPITIPPFIPAPIPDVPAELLQISEANNHFEKTADKLETAIAHDLVTHQSAGSDLTRLHKLVDSYASHVRTLTSDILKDSDLSAAVKTDVLYIRHLTTRLEQKLDHDIRGLRHDINHHAEITTDLAKLVDIQDAVKNYEIAMHD